jgi:hypothetical protein
MLEGMGRDEMRAADADRRAVADSLRSALEEGRLDLDEYDERVRRAYAAKTYGELRPLVYDLPQKAEDTATRRWLLQLWGGYLSVVAITTMVWIVSCLASLELIYFWPVWVAGPWGAVLLGRTVNGLSREEPRIWQQRLERQRQRNDPESTV